MMWLNPSGRIGAGEHFDQPLFDERYRRTSPAKVVLGSPSPAALADVDKKFYLFIFLKEAMEASNDGRQCAGGGGGNWLDLDKIYEHAPFPLISQAPFRPPRRRLGLSPLRRSVRGRR